jgi:anti-anti-sigma regulatory factor
LCCGEDSDVRGVEVREIGEEGVLVELRGEFDRYNLEDLRETLNDVVALRLPVMLDLSGVHFLDVEATRELTIYSYLYAHHLTLRNPSWQVRASVAACGLGSWLNFRYEAGDTTCPRAS